MSKRGGARPGSGRKSKADEIKLVEMMDSILTPQEAWEKLAEFAQTDIVALKLWMEYRFGKPKQQVDVTTNGDSVNIPTAIAVTVHTPKTDE